ncbi:hypothetical protein [uncultured Thiodictyon sp.]|uniref:hypothetical protein n=1 Tax=uncultured Thiodictyon sp. TaxID=1846217 RepID=UPI0025F9D6B5|nr:hypothetical protein [uncultured Thiodictyon sp.]
MKTRLIASLSFFLLSGCVDVFKTPLDIISKDGGSPDISGEYIEASGEKYIISQPYSHLYVLNFFNGSIVFEAEDLSTNGAFANRNYFLLQVKKAYCKKNNDKNCDETQGKDVHGEIFIGRLSGNELSFFLTGQCSNVELAKSNGLTFHEEKNAKQENTGGYIFDSINTHKGLLDFFSSCVSTGRLNKPADVFDGKRL